MTHVRFDYSKALTFLENMKLHIYVMRLRSHTILYMKKQAQVVISQDGQTFLPNMTKKNFHAFKKVLKKSNQILTFYQ